MKNIFFGVRSAYREVGTPPGWNPGKREMGIKREVGTPPGRNPIKRDLMPKNVLQVGHQARDGQLSITRQTSGESTSNDLLYNYPEPLRALLGLSCRLLLHTLLRGCVGTIFFRASGASY